LCLLESCIVIYSISWVLAIMGFISGFFALVVHGSIGAYLPALAFTIGMVAVHLRILYLLWPWDSASEYYDLSEGAVQVALWLNWVGMIIAITAIACAGRAMFIVSMKRRERHMRRREASLN